MSQTQTQQFVTVEMFQELLDKFVKLETEVQELKAPKSTTPQREMSDDDAKRILTGDLKDTKHNKAAEILGLSYGQIYSCRGEYTFRHIHKELRNNPEYKNPWKK